jgi:hypothetical protein
MVDNSLYLAYYSGTVSEEDTYDGVEYHFYKVDNNGLTDLIATSNYSKVRDMFGMKGELLYFYEKSNELQGLNYGGEEILDGEYDYIENACCCQPAIWEISGNQKDKVSFFGKKENQWYKVIVETKKS